MLISLWVKLYALGNLSLVCQTHIYCQDWLLLSGVLWVLDGFCYHEFPAWTIYEDIIHVTYHSLKVMEDLRHRVLEHFGCRGDTERETVEVEASEWHNEGCEKMWRFFKRNLPEARFCIKFWVKVAALKFQEHVFDCCCGMYFLFYSFVEACEIYTDVNLPVKF